MALNHDFIESTTELLIKKLSDESENSLGDDLDDFLNIFNINIDKFFKLDQPKNLNEIGWSING